MIVSVPLPSIVKALPDAPQFVINNSCPSTPGGRVAVQAPPSVLANTTWSVTNTVYVVVTLVVFLLIPPSVLIEPEPTSSGFITKSVLL